MYLCRIVMRRKKTENELLEKVLILDIASDGKSVAKVDEMVVFVEKAVPGDIVDVQLYRKKKNFAEGKAVLFHEYSKLRADAFCEHFGVCGGCKWQNMSYDAQLQFKQKQVVDSLERLAKVKLPEIAPILGSAGTTYYRNKL